MKPIVRFSYIVYHSAMIERIGIFLLLVGTSLLTLAWVSGQLDHPFTIRVLFSGFLCAFVGWKLWQRGRDHQPAERFRLARKLLSKKKKEQE